MPWKDRTVSTISIDEPLLSVVDVAERLGVSVRTIRTMINDGRIRAVRVGVQIRVEPAALREYLTANVEPPRGGDAS
jgi:excisionase family DNA binding protein